VVAGFRRPHGHASAP